MVIAFLLSFSFWLALYRLNQWEHKDETDEERKLRYRITLGL